jgi:hypothetical protein
MSDFLSTNYRLDWERFCAAQPAAIAAELQALLDATHGNNDEADGHMAHVVGKAATDPTMARLALRRLMPGIVSIARRRARIEASSFPELLHELVGNAWILVCSYPIERRPRKIAANLTRDVEYITFVQPRRLRRIIETTSPSPVVNVTSAPVRNSS